MLGAYESFLAAARIEHIVVFDFDLGKPTAFGGNRATFPRDLLLFGQ
jgi:hypothetical protein